MTDKTYQIKMADGDEWDILATGTDEDGNQQEEWVATMVTFALAKQVVTMLEQQG